MQNLIWLVGVAMMVLGMGNSKTHDAIFILGMVTVIVGVFGIMGNPTPLPPIYE